MSIDTAVILCGGRALRFQRSVRNELHACENGGSPYLPPRKCTLSHATIRNLGKKLPKCLLPVKGEPLLVHKLRQLTEAGITRCAIPAGPNARAIRACIQERGLDRKLKITVTGNRFFKLEDLACIADAAKRFGQPQHMVVTAGDCLTTTNYRELMAYHLSGTGYLTLSTTQENSRELFVQDSVVSADFIQLSVAQSSRNKINFQGCSPFIAAVQYAWRADSLSTFRQHVHHVNVNELRDYERLLAAQDIILPPKAPPLPRLAEYARNHEVRNQRFPLQP